MPQLTPEFDRVIVHSMMSSDATYFDVVDTTKLTLMVQEIRISEDYCHSDIIIVDLANCTMEHAAKISLAHIKKYELCVLVSEVVIRNMLTALKFCDQMSLSKLCVQKNLTFF
jgi:hypothetical protein